MKKGFSLIEMLVVVAIIGILAALLAPSLQKALGAAKTIECSNNIKQFSLSAVMFSEDYDGYLPPVVVTRKKSGFEGVLFPSDAQAELSKNYAWYNKVASNCYWPYLENLRFAFCSSHPDIAKFSDNSLQMSWQNWNGYMLSSNFFSSTNAYGGTVHTNKSRLSGIPHPSKLFMILDQVKLNFSQSFQKNWDTQYTNVGWYHSSNSGFNAGFFDGHVSFIPLSWEPTGRYDPPFVRDNWE